MSDKSRLRMRSQGPPKMEESEGIKQPMVPSPATAEQRLSQELQVKLEVLRLHPAHNGEEGETVETVLRMTRSAKTTPRPPSTIIPTSRSNSILGTLVSREVSTSIMLYQCIIPLQKTVNKTIH